MCDNERNEGNEFLSLIIQRIKLYSLHIFWQIFNSVMATCVIAQFIFEIKQYKHSLRVPFCCKTTTRLLICKQQSLLIQCHSSKLDFVNSSPLGNMVIISPAAGKPEFSLW